MWDGIMIGSECADWWDKRLKDYHAELEQYVLDNPGNFSVFVATAGATGADFAHTMVVDLARLGEGAAEGTAGGILRDLLRAMNFIPQGRILSGSRTFFGAIAQRISNLAIWRHIGGGLCAPIAIVQAVQRAGYRIGVGLHDVAKAIGKPLDVLAKSGTSPSLIGQTLKALGLNYSEVSAATRQGMTSFQALKQLAAGQPGPMLVGIHAPGGVGHRIVVGKTSAGIKIIDRYGMFDSLEALSKHYGVQFSINTASPMFTIANAVIDPSLVRLVSQGGVLAALVRQSAAVFDLNFSRFRSAAELDADFERYLAKRGRKPVMQLPEMPVTGGKTVVVTRGDPARSTLSGIAKAQYGSMDLWPLLHDLNKQVIGPNPNRIQAGMKLLVLPLSTYTPAEIADARKRAPSWRNHPL